MVDQNSRLASLITIRRISRRQRQLKATPDQAYTGHELQLSRRL